MPVHIFFYLMHLEFSISIEDYAVELHRPRLQALKSDGKPQALAHVGRLTFRALEAQKLVPPRASGPTRSWTCGRSRARSLTPFQRSHDGERIDVAILRRSAVSRREDVAQPRFQIVAAPVRRPSAIQLKRAGKGRIVVSAPRIQAAVERRFRHF